MSDPADEPERDAVIVSFPRARPAREPDVGPVSSPPLREVIGEVLRFERTEQGRTLSDVAGDAHVSLPYLSEVERGRKEVSSDVLMAICDALELPLIDVLERAADRLRARAQGSHRVVLLAA